MAIPGTEIGGTYHIQGLFFRAKFQEIYPQFLWPEIWYVYVPPSVGSWRSPTMFRAGQEAIFAMRKNGLSGKANNVINQPYFDGSKTTH